MNRLRPPLFLARAVYRRRRLRDAARLLPLVGMFLLILPALGVHGDSDGRAVGAGAVYVFVVWAVLIGLAALLAPGLASPDRGDGRSDGNSQDV